MMQSTASLVLASALVLVVSAARTRLCTKANCDTELCECLSGQHATCKVTISDPSTAVSVAGVTGCVSTFCSCIGTPTRTNGASSSSDSGSSSDRVCVAEEHLVGFETQHATHILHHVLCARGFCATPHHAILVLGKWTSMKKMCASQWTCTSAIKLVNNLKISQTTRVRFDDVIVFTPYDDRFWIFLQWGVQMAQDVVELVSFSLKWALLLSVALVVYANLKIGEKMSVEAVAGDDKQKAGSKPSIGISCSSQTGYMTKQSFENPIGTDVC